MVHYNFVRGLMWASWRTWLGNHGRQAKGIYVKDKLINFVLFVY
jgi:hypothetical protein